MLRFCGDYADGRRDLSDMGCYQIARVGRERRKLRRVKVGSWIGIRRLQQDN